MEIRVNIKNCAECPNYKFYKKCKVLDIKVNKKDINEKCPLKKRYTIMQNEICKDILNRENPNKEFIKRLIKSKGLSYRKIAELLQVDKDTIRLLIKKNRHRGNVQLQYNLSQILNCDRDILYPTVCKNEFEKKLIKSWYGLNKDYQSFGDYKETLDANKKNQ